MPRITRWTAVTAVAFATVLAATSGAGAAEGSAARAQSAPRPVYWSAQPQE